MRHHARVQDEESSTSQLSHTEKHFESPRIISDVIIGFSDGLCVPFALVSGLASLQSSRIVVLAGFAEIFSGAISMGLGGYLAAKSESDHYKNERRREELEVEHDPDEEEAECMQIFKAYGLSSESITPLIKELRTGDRDQWVNFMMKFELGLEQPSMRTAWFSAATIGLSYFIGGFIPLLPYLVFQSTYEALCYSIGLTAIVLFIFGWIKSKVLVSDTRLALCSAMQTLLIGAIAASTAYALVKLMDSFTKDN